MILLGSQIYLREQSVKFFSSAKIVALRTCKETKKKEQKRKTKALVKRVITPIVVAARAYWISVQN